MKRFFLIVFGWMIGMSVQVSGHAGLIWRTPSTDSSASMPCGGGDIGMNVWVEDGDVLFYISRSGTFDEHNCLLKQGRIRLRLSVCMPVVRNIRHRVNPSVRKLR